MLINRQILYFKHSSDNSDIAGMSYKAIRPFGMDDADFNSILNFFKKIVDETKVEGLRYSDDTLMKYNLNHFCLNGGTLLFKVIEATKMPGSGVPELYGFFTPLSDVRTMWLSIDKMCYLLAAETPGSAKDGAIDYDVLSEYDSNTIHGVKSYYRTSLENMMKDLLSSPFPINVALTASPDEFFPQGVKFYSNGMTSEKTDSTLKEVEIEFDKKKIRYSIGKCNQSLKHAHLVSIPHDDELKGGFLKLKKKNDGTSKAIRQWNYEYTNNGEQQSDNCDFITIDKSFEYSPVGDTFNAYIGNIGVNAEKLPRVEGARLVSKVATLEPEIVEAPPQKMQKTSNAAANPVAAVTPKADKYGKPDKLNKQKEEAVKKVVESSAIETNDEETTAVGVQQKAAVKPKPEKTVKAPKAEKVEKAAKASKPAKPSKPPKAGVKVHPLLQQAQERRDEEARTARAERTAPIPPPPRPERSFGENPSRSKFGQKVHPLIQQAQDNSDNSNGGRTDMPPRPESRPSGDPGRPTRSKFAPKPHYSSRQEQEDLKHQADLKHNDEPPLNDDNNVVQAEINNTHENKTESRPAPLPRYAPPQEK
ncbi:MAG: hypothetical protein FWF94_07395 [Oscillospiraceae bacterium]|nr:hypothetical protein [Oscillospiraceae bacterium]